MISRCPFPRPADEDVTSLESFLYFVWEREAVRLARENDHEAPWTKDELLQKYRFCNIRRRDDRMTRWMVENMFQHIDPEDDGWFIAAVARYINWPPMLSILLSEGLIPGKVENFDPSEFGDCVDAVTESGGKAWGAAYMTFPGKIETGIGKGLSTAKYILAPLAKRADSIRAAVASNSVEALVNSMVGSYGWSTFMAGQVAADLTYIEPMNNAIDLRTWAPIGPGSSLGLAYLAEVKETQKWTQEEFNKMLMKLLEDIKLQLDIEDLTLHDVQNCCCEHSKYIKLRRGGRVRATYKPETAY